MGIARAMTKMLMREGTREKFSGNALSLGRQDIFGTAADFQNWAKEMNFQLKPGVKMLLSPHADASAKNHIDDQSLFLSLGIYNLESMDCNAEQKSTFVHDLNQDVPKELHGKYDLIYDGGTAEHVFNFPKVLENCHKMLRTGGRIIHAVPANNLVDHGFYMFSPSLLWEYYSINHWKVLYSYLWECTRKYDTDLWNIYNYTPGCLDKFSFGGFNSSNIFCTFFVAQKTEQSTFTAFPQQKTYSGSWKYGDITNPESIPTWKKKINPFFPQWLKIILHPIYRRMPFSYHLKLIARY